MRKSISVGMTTYNSSKFVGEQLQSIFCQTRLPDEIVIFDDASTDSTVEILNEIKKKSPVPIFINVNEKNLGFVNNFEKCFLRCSGEIIISCDADDIWFPDKVEKIEKAFSSGNVSYVYHDAIVVDGDGNKIKESLNADWDTAEQKEGRTQFMLRNLQRKGFPSGMCIAFRRDILEYICPFGFGHDEWISLCAPLFGEIRCIAEPLTYYRRHGKNASGNPDVEYAKNKFSKLIVQVKQMLTSSPERWFTWPDCGREAYRFYINNFENIIPQVVLKEAKEQLYCREILCKAIEGSRIHGLKCLVRLYREGLYKKYRGNIHMFIMDVFFMCFHFK